MLYWEFEHHAQDHRQFWLWRALRADGRVYRHSERHFTSFLKAFEDASRHGFDQQRHPWDLATRTYHPAPYSRLAPGLRARPVRGPRRKPQ